MSATLAAFLFIGVDDRAPLAGRHRADVIVRVLSPPIIDLIQISSGIEMPEREGSCCSVAAEIRPGRSQRRPEPDGAFRTSAQQT